jgi:hypothetical protein
MVSLPLWIVWLAVVFGLGGEGEAAGFLLLLGWFVI